MGTVERCPDGLGIVEVSLDDLDVGKRRELLGGVGARVPSDGARDELSIGVGGYRPHEAAPLGTRGADHDDRLLPVHGGHPLRLTRVVGI